MRISFSQLYRIGIVKVKKRVQRSLPLTQTPIKRVFHNIGFLSIANAIQAVATFLLYAYIGRILGVTDFGSFTVATSFATIAMTIAKLGLEILLVREISREFGPDERIGRRLLSF